MLHTLRSAIENFRKFDDLHRDRRLESYFLMNNAWHMFGLVMIYYIFVKHLGPKMMAKRKPFELKWVLLVYNTAQIFFNLHFLISCIYHIVVEKPYDTFFCMIPNRGNDHVGRLELQIAYRFFLLKVVDYLETVFFVLRKRYNQITFLHIYHHIMVTSCGFVILRYSPGGQFASFCILNSLVHTMMYCYYFVSAFRPELKQSLWWKKHITQAQLIQFFILLVHYGVPLIRGNCAFPRLGLQLAILQNIIMIVMFSKFYYKAYMRKPKSAITSKQKLTDVTNDVKKKVK